MILHLRSIFAKHGIPETVVSDNEFVRFAREEGFILVTTQQTFHKWAIRGPRVAVEKATFMAVGCGGGDSSIYS